VTRDAGALIACAALLGGALMAEPKTAGDPAARNAAAGARVRAIADEYWAAYVERYPEVATSLGVARAPHGRITDNSLGVLARWRIREDAWLREVRALEPRVPPADPAGVLAGVLRHTLEASVRTRACRTELWGVSDTGSGWQQSFADVAAAQPVGSPEKRQMALSRWRELARFIDTEVVNLREGVKQGTTAAKSTVHQVIAQLDALAVQPESDSPFFDPARRDGDPAFHDALARIVADDIRPAIKRYRDFLERDYLPKARESIAVSANPDGEACYRAAVSAFTTIDLTPRDIHERGLAEMAKIDAEMKVIAERSFKTSDVPALLERLRTDPQYLFKSRDELIAYAQAAVDRARAAMPRWFGILPKADVVIRPHPAYREPTADQYNSPAEDGSRPGVYLISTYEPEKKSKCGPESTAFHETIPGHHLQNVIALERKDGHPLLRFGVWLPGGVYNAAYGEGWALYAERLADEMGLFSSDMDRLGMLGQQAWRAARLVVDPGMHVLGWSRQQAIDYMLAHTTAARAEVESEVDRYIAWPGQAVGYMIGALEIRRIREDAENRLGPRFDIRQFHDRVLEDGSLPLPMLRQKIDRWATTAPRTDGAGR